MVFDATYTHTHSHITNTTTARFTNSPLFLQENDDDEVVFVHRDPTSCSFICKQYVRWYCSCCRRVLEERLRKNYMFVVAVIGAVVVAVVVVVAPVGDD